jgi:hypothetical protein
MRRVTRGPVVILTFDGDALDRFWLAGYVPELMPIPIDCTDGFTEAFYARPDQFLVEGVRRSQSAWGFVDPAVEARFVRRLAADLDSGEWDRRYGHLRSAPTFAGSLRLVIALPS